jgi:hypothetical protein
VVAILCSILLNPQRVNSSHSYFAGSQLLDCSFLASDIKTCQAKGKKVTISLGGATGGGMADAAFADLIWDLFLGGNCSTRPFGDAVLDGSDFFYANDIHQNTYLCL